MKLPTHVLKYRWPSNSDAATARICLKDVAAEVVTVGGVKAPRFLQVRFPDNDGVYTCRNPKTLRTWYLGEPSGVHQMYYIGKDEDQVRAATKVYASVLDRPEAAADNPSGRHDHGTDSLLNAMQEQHKKLIY